jgi:hypothetical protein
MKSEMMQSLERRVFLSVSADGDAYLASAARSANATGSIRLDLVVLHELGHALGLDHVNNTSSIMYPYYNATYNINNLANDPVVTALKNKFATPNSGPWKDSADPQPGNGVVNITYSFMLDGARMDKRSNTLFRSLDARMPRSTWQGIFTADLNRWASASGNKVSFTLHSDNGASFGTAGSAQNDSHFGDIRIGAHRFDGPSKVLAHTYFPPPNGGTAAGDLHLDEAEGWSASSSTLTSSATTQLTANNTIVLDGNDSDSGFGHEHGHRDRHVMRIVGDLLA